MTFRRVLAAAGLVPALAAGACREASAPPPEAQIRTILFHRQDTGENLLLNTDGSNAGTFASSAPGLVPIGASTLGHIAVLLDGAAVVLVTLDHPGERDTIIHPAPAVLSLASFSPDETLVAVASYVPDAAVLVFDRPNRRVDTLPYGTNEPALPPLLGPDDDRVVLISVNPLSMSMTQMFRSNRSRMQTSAVGVARAITRPIFGWPRWTDAGIVMAFVRVAAVGADTLVVGRIDPDAPEVPLQELYHALMVPVADGHAELGIGDYSTYALTADGDLLVLGAEALAGAGRQALYLVSPAAPRVQPLLDVPGQNPVFPLFFRE
jgi:hypothetical protein